MLPPLQVVPWPDTCTWVAQDRISRNIHGTTGPRGLGGDQNRGADYFAALAAHVAGREPEALVFTAVKGGALRAQGFQRTVLTETAASLGMEGLHPHALRHTAASLAIASGANVNVVQQMLGHKSAIMTLDLYGHLFPDQLDEVADRLDAAARAVVYPLCTRADIIPMSMS